MIFREKWDVVFVQNPSLILAFFTVIICRFSHIPVIVDCHNIGILFEHRNRYVERIGQFVNIFIIRSASLTLVTNDRLAEFVEEELGRAYVLPDPFPKFGSYSRVTLRGRKNILFICSFSPDEPFSSVIEAGKYVDPSIIIHVTGRYPKDLPGKVAAQNVVLTGFLCEEEFVSYLHSVDVVMVLTDRENCLVCGGYEGIAAWKPLILSNKLMLKDFYQDAAIYTDNTPLDIALRIKQALVQESDIYDKVRRLKHVRSAEWAEKKKNLEVKIHELIRV